MSTVNTKVEATTETKAIVKLNVIPDSAGANKLLAVEYNGVLCETPEQRMDALRNHFRLSVLRKYGINPRNEDGEPLKNTLIINGQMARPKLPALHLDEATGFVTENIEEYYDRTRNRAAAAYNAVFKGLENIAFVPKML